MIGLNKKRSSHSMVSIIIQAHVYNFNGGAVGRAFAPSVEGE